MENNQSTLNDISYKIEFKQHFTTVVIASNIPDFVTAVKFALSLHEASNITHSIYVLHDDIADVVFHRN